MRLSVATMVIFPSFWMAGWLSDVALIAATGDFG